METPDVTEVDPEIEELWRDVLERGRRRRLAFLPGRARCTACRVAMRGFGGRIVRLATGIRPSRRNPGFCNLCDDALPPGGADVDIAVLFADVVGSTGLAETLGPRGFAALLNRFYDAASRAVLSRDGMIDRMGGDEVVALFFPSAGPRYRANAVHAAVRLLRLLGYGSPGRSRIPVGVGISAGTAFCGRIELGEVSDFTALGETMSLGARLSAQARPGQIVMSEELYGEVEEEHPGLRPLAFRLRGSRALLRGRVLTLGGPLPKTEGPA